MGRRFHDVDTRSSPSDVEKTGSPGPECQTLGIGRRGPLESIDGSEIERACEEYGVELVGPLPDEN